MLKSAGERTMKIKRGYKTIFIREEEILDKNWEIICLNKIKGNY